MPTYRVAANGSDTGTGSDANPFKTLTKAGSVLMPGDTLLVQGKVTGSLTPPVSGTAAKPVTIRGLESAELTKQVQLADRQHIVLENLKLTSTGGMWVNTNKASSNLTFINPVLASAAYNGTKYPFVGMLLHGNRHRLINATVGTWYGGDAIQLHGDYNLVEGGDWSKCRCDHGPLMVYGSYNVVRGTDPSKPIRITNPFARGGSLSPE